MSDLVFIDAETTGLEYDADIWELAAVRRQSDGSESTLELFVEHSAAKCARLPEPFLADHHARYGVDHLRRRTPGGRPIFTRGGAAEMVHAFLAGRPHIVGAVPNFDTERLARLFRGVGVGVGPGLPDQPWHHHLIDVENLAVGWLAAQGTEVLRPWDSNRLSRAVGVDPNQFARHTAMGDVRWAMAIHDVVSRPGAEVQRLNKQVAILRHQLAEARRSARANEREAAAPECLVDRRDATDDDPRLQQIHDALDQGDGDTR